MIHSDLENPEYVKWKNFLSDTDSWSREEVQKYQLKELKISVESAFRNTAGYATLCNELGVTPADLQTISDIKQFPTVEKETLRDDLADFTYQALAKEYITTGGSTGTPFGFYREADSFAKELASKAHQYARIGWKEGDRQIIGWSR